LNYQSKKTPEAEAIPPAGCFSQILPPGSRIAALMKYRDDEGEVEFSTLSQPVSV
jgi:hypothetical protein